MLWKSKKIRENSEILTAYGTVRLHGEGIQAEVQGSKFLARAKDDWDE